MEISKKVGDFSKKDDKSLLCFLQTKEITFLKNISTSLYFCFLKCIVNITDEGAKVIDYKDLLEGVYVNEDNIILHNFKNVFSEIDTTCSNNRDFFTELIFKNTNFSNRFFN